MAVKEIVDQTYLPSDFQEQAAVIDFIARLPTTLAQGGHARLLDPEGREVVLPNSMIAVLAQVADAMQAGLAVTIAPHHLTLSTQEAADLLRISRTTLVRLLERGVIPFDKPGRHRKVRLSDLIEYRRRQRHVADQALAEIVADTERLGLYDEQPDAIQRALAAARSASRAE